MEIQLVITHGATVVGRRSHLPLLLQCLVGSHAVLHDAADLGGCEGREGRTALERGTRLKWAVFDL